MNQYLICYETITYWKSQIFIPLYYFYLEKHWDFIHILLQVHIFTKAESLPQFITKTVQ